MLDFTSREKKFLTVKLSENTTVFLRTPKKALYTELKNLKTRLENKDDVTDEYDEILSITRKILSENVQKKTFTQDEVEEMFDIDDAACLITEYTKFIGGILSNPN